VVTKWPPCVPFWRYLTRDERRTRLAPTEGDPEDHTQIVVDRRRSEISPRCFRVDVRAFQADSRRGTGSTRLSSPKKKGEAAAISRLPLPVGTGNSVCLAVAGTARCSRADGSIRIGGPAGYRRWCPCADRAAGAGEPRLRLPPDPRRTCRARYPDRGQRLGRSFSRPGSSPHRGARPRPGGSSCEPRPAGSSPATSRPHPSLHQRPPIQEPPPGSDGVVAVDHVQRRDVLGGLMHEYKAAM
jgi:hypothetical protein